MSSSSTNNTQYDFGAPSSDKDDLLRGLPDPFITLNEVHRQYLLPFEKIISATPTRFVLVVPTNGDAIKAIRDTANGMPYGKVEANEVFQKFDVSGIEFLAVNQSVARREGPQPVVVHLADEELGNKFIEALPFSYVAATFAKEGASRIFASDWRSFALKVKNGLRFAANPPLAVKLFNRDHEVKSFNPNLAWVARPSTTDGWLNRPGEI